MLRRTWKLWELSALVALLAGAMGIVQAGYTAPLVSGMFLAPLWAVLAANRAADRAAWRWIRQGGGGAGGFALRSTGLALKVVSGLMTGGSILILIAALWFYLVRYTEE